MKKKLWLVAPKHGRSGAVKVAANSKEEAEGIWRAATSSGTPLLVVETAGEVLV